MEVNENKMTVRHVLKVMSILMWVTGILGQTKQELEVLVGRPKILNVSDQRVTQPPWEEARAHDSDQYDANTYILSM